MNSDIIDIYYFTGTGNTLLLTKKLVTALEQGGKKVNLFPLEKANPSKINLKNTLGLTFPVACFSTYPFVWRFFEDLPLGHGAEVFMLDTLAGFSGGIVGPLKKLLLQKGYRPLGAAEFIMPGNYGAAIPAPEKQQRKIAKASLKVERYAAALLRDRGHWHRIPLLSAIIRLISRLPQPWRSVAKTISLDQNSCVKCGLCAKICPVNAITMREFPEKNRNCVGCMRCIAFCPKNAILYKGKQKRYRAIDRLD